VARKRDTLIGSLTGAGWNWQAAGAAVGLIGGLISSIVGSVLTAIAWFSGPLWHGIHIQRDGTALLFLTIPLLIIGACGLDLLDRKMERAEENQVIKR
jgi:hypothetical protein